MITKPGSRSHIRERNMGVAGPGKSRKRPDLAPVVEMIDQDKS